MYKRGDRIIGKGAFGMVIEGWGLKPPRKKVAIKIIKKGGMTNDDLAS
jgi:hypothetical protein